jgi:uncharacterized peroxidase-related enzyme
VEHHVRSFRRAGGLRSGDPRSLPLPPRRRAILEYAEKLTRAPAEFGTGNVDALRAAGLTDREILDLAMVVRYFAFANRLVDGLGVELER